MSTTYLMTDERFWTKVTKTDTCWLWTGAKAYGGYGYVTAIRDAHRTTVGAHRVAYEKLVGPIPVGLQLDHLCRVRNCVNPTHLEPVTARENSLRGENPAWVAHRTDTCFYGHSLMDAYVRPGQNRRECRVCHKARNDRRNRTKVAS